MPIESGNRVLDVIRGRQNPPESKKAQSNSGKFANGTRIRGRTLQLAPSGSAGEFGEFGRFQMPNPNSNRKFGLTPHVIPKNKRGCHSAFLSCMAPPIWYVIRASHSCASLAFTSLWPTLTGGPERRPVNQRPCFSSGFASELCGSPSLPIHPRQGGWSAKDDSISAQRTTFNQTAFTEC